MVFTNRQLLILTSALTTFFFIGNAHATAFNNDANLEENTVYVSIDSDKNYHISFYTHEILNYGAEQEARERKMQRSWLTSRVDGNLTTTEQRIQGLVSAIKYFTEESPRNFSLEPWGDKYMIEELGERQGYYFCVYFGPALKTGSCIRTAFTVNEVDLNSILSSAGIEYATLSSIAKASLRASE